MIFLDKIPKVFGTSKVFHIFEHMDKQNIHTKRKQNNNDHGRHHINGGRGFN